MTSSLSSIVSASSVTSADVPSSDERRDELGQADFLELMVAQLKAQDPFKPLESGEFMSQLAQFGTVDGVRDLQTSFDTLSGSLKSLQALQASSLVGRDVLVESSQGILPAGGQLEGAVHGAQNGATVVFNIQDSTGQRVRDIAVTADAEGRARFAWDGIDAAGVASPPGRYTVAASTLSGNEPVAAQTLIRAGVESVTLDGAGLGLQLNLTGLGSIVADDVVEIL